jgi:uncharacterized membrane protein YdfJ with MMPL/SSD domain
VAESPLRIGSAGAAAFARLGRAIVRRPTVPIVVWVVLLVAAIPFLHLLGGVTTNSAQTLPSSAPSAQAAARLAQLFPNTTEGSSTILLFSGGNVTDAFAQRVIENVTARLEGDRSLVDVAAISSVYSAYAGYLAGQAQLAAGVLAPALALAPSLPESVNASAALLWGPPALFLSDWTALVANNSSDPPQWNADAYDEANAALAGEPAERAVLSTFYFGWENDGAGFNGTAACAGKPTVALASACANATAAINLDPFVVGSGEIPLPEQPLAHLVLVYLSLDNATNWPFVRFTGSVDLANASGLSALWIDRVWAAFPSAALSNATAAAFGQGLIANATLWTAGPTVPAAPYALLAQYVNAPGTGSLIDVSFSASDDATNASGGQPVYADLGIIDSDVRSVLAADDPTGSISYFQTGTAPLDLLSQQAVNSSLQLVLPLTVGLLLAISMVYFRSPVTPLVTFGGLGIALVLGLGGTVLVGTLVSHVDTTALTLEEVFVLGVGTDYSIFLVARYREELVRGTPPDEAVVASLAWAGQSVATSGSAAIMVTVALTFSGIALLSQWGLVLSVAILNTMLLSLTMVPACLTLLGPRIFWPTSGERFRRHAAVVAGRLHRRETYFYRAGQASARRPGLVVGAVLLVTVPLAVVALSVPLSYDFYGQLPAGHPATVGLAQLDARFGPGFATESFVLVEFASPLLPGGVPNDTEFEDLANLTARAGGTPGVAAVQSPIGPYGASLSEWLALPTLPSATQQNLLGLAGAYVGTDGRTVLLTVQTNTTGLSTSAVATVHALAATLGSYAASHPEVEGLAYGGAAPVISDLADETDRATELMLVAVTIGLVVVLLAVLRSWMIALLAVGTIALSISWAWAITYLVFDELLGFPLFFYVRTILFMLILGLGIDYNIFLLTRVREERLKGRSAGDAAVEAVARTGGIITAAAVILACAFGALLAGDFTLIRAIGFSVALAVILDAMVVRTYLVPSALRLLGERVWTLSGRRPAAPASAPAGDLGASSRPPDGDPTP